jgi:hypothetical protein
MKAALVIPAIIIAGLTAANAQGAGPYYERSIHQSAGDRDSRGYPKYYQRYGHSRHHAVPSTTGAGPAYGYGANGRPVPPQGPFYENSIHQSAGDRDSRGYPKYCRDC